MAKHARVLGVFGGLDAELGFCELATLLDDPVAAPASDAGGGVQTSVNFSRSINQQRERVFCSSKRRANTRTHLDLSDHPSFLRSKSALGSERSEYPSSFFDFHLICAVGLSHERPITVAPCSSYSFRMSRYPHAWVVQPGVSA